MTLLADQRVAANIVTEVLLELKRLTAPGVSLGMLDEVAERMIRERGGEPCNKGYKPDWAREPYPSTICASVDWEVCHAPPAGRELREGSIVKYDLGVRYQSGCGDAALTVAVGEIDNRKRRAMRHGIEALNAGLHAVRAGAKVSDIGRAIEKYALPRGYNVIREFGGHKIGKEMHEEPTIASTTGGLKSSREFLEEGWVICIEPMLTPGDGKVSMSLTDGWTYFCKDGQPVVMFETMALVKKDGYEILTDHLNVAVDIS